MKFKPGDLIIGTSNSYYSITCEGSISQVLEVSNHTINIRVKLIEHAKENSEARDLDIGRIFEVNPNYFKIAQEKKSNKPKWF